MKFVGAEFFAGGIWNVFACGARTSSPMDKRRPQLDSACSKGAGNTSHDFFNSSGDGL